MDAFDDGFGGEGEVEVDPAAEFLAKEQEELGDIGQYPANYQASGFNDKQIIGEDLGLNSAGEQLVEGGEPIQAFKEEEVNCMFLYFYCAQSSALHFSSYSFLNSVPVSLHHHAPTSFHNFQCFHWRHAWKRNTFNFSFAPGKLGYLWWWLPGDFLEGSVFLRPGFSLSILN